MSSAIMRLSLTALLVRDYDEAIRWYCNVLGFRLVNDDDQGGGKRWVVIEDDSGRGILLARAIKPEELAAVGNQHGGRVGFFMETGDFNAAYEKLEQVGASFDEAPRSEPYGKVVVFRDLYGNRWDLIQRNGAS